MTTEIRNRKSEHIRICVENDVEAGDAGFGRTKLVPRSLPEIDFDRIDMSVELFGKTLSYPIIIEGMTGGTKKAERINKDIASVAARFNIGFGVGSQRAAIEDPAVANTYRVRDVAPKIFLIGNLGAVQLNYGYTINECNKAVEMIDADALALHINPLQEVVQTEGNRDFSGLIHKINKIAKGVKKPVIVKGVGEGIGYETAKKLRVGAIDVGGSGGTSWARVEDYRKNSKTSNKISNDFYEWGIPTVQCLLENMDASIPIIASGGVRSGTDIAKSIAVGATCSGFALPVLRAYMREGKKGVEGLLNRVIWELQTAMFLTGSSNLYELKGKFKYM